jgi:hypothetical protein
VGCRGCITRREKNEEQPCLARSRVGSASPRIALVGRWQGPKSCTDVWKSLQSEKAVALKSGSNQHKQSPRCGSNPLSYPRKCGTSSVSLLDTVLARGVPLSARPLRTACKTPGFTLVGGPSSSHHSRHVEPTQAKELYKPPYPRPLLLHQGSPVAQATRMAAGVRRGRGVGSPSSCVPWWAPVGTQNIGWKLRP